MNAATIRQRSLVTPPHQNRFGWPGRYRHPGFTLLELLIASSLTAVLLVLVWSLFGIYTKLNDKGAQQAAKLQLTRAWIRQLRADLRHAIPETPRPQTGFVSAPAAAPPVPTNSTLSNPLPNGPALVGTSTSLQFVMRTTREPLPPTNSAEKSDDKTTLPDIYDQVNYEWFPREAPGMAGFGESMKFDSNREPSLSDRTGNRLLTGESDRSDEQPRDGLVRRVIPWHQATATSVQPPERDGGRFTTRRDPTEDNESELATIVDHIPEIARLRFRYFNGRTWQGQWNSQAQQGMPAAIEISFDIEDPDQIRRQELEQFGAPLANEFTADQLESPDSSATDLTTGTEQGPRGVGIQARVDGTPLEYRSLIFVGNPLRKPASPRSEFP